MTAATRRPTRTTRRARQECPGEKAARSSRLIDDAGRDIDLPPLARDAASPNIGDLR